MHFKDYIVLVTAVDFHFVEYGRIAKGMHFSFNILTDVLMGVFQIISNSSLHPQWFNNLRVMWQRLGN